MVRCLNQIEGHKCYGKYVKDFESGQYVCDFCGQEIEGKLYDILQAVHVKKVLLEAEH
jgi:hypothetical protein